MPKAPSPKEIRELYSDYMNEWREIREEAKTDMRFVAGDPWDPKDRKAREDAGRPCISLDEINQYLNQAINNIRQNKRSIQVTPKGFGANDDNAEHRENIIRGIERRSDGQGTCITAYENALQRSYGFAMLKTDYVEGMTFDQEVRFRRIANPDAVLIDPNYKLANAADIKRAFVLDLMRKEEFKRKYPRKKVEGFSLDEAQELKDWIRDRYVQVAELWYIHETPRKLLLIDVKGQPTPFWEDEADLKG